MAKKLLVLIFFILIVLIYTDGAIAYYDDQKNPPIGALMPINCGIIFTIRDDIEINTEAIEVTVVDSNGEDITETLTITYTDNESFVTFMVKGMPIGKYAVYITVKNTNGNIDLVSAKTVTVTTCQDNFSTTTTTIDCLAEELYGEYAKETKLLRYFRDNVLRKTSEGQKAIKLYYKLSPTVLELMKRDSKAKLIFKNVVDGMLPFIQWQSESQGVK